MVFRAKSVFFVSAVCIALCVAVVFMRRQLLPPIDIGSPHGKPPVASAAHDTPFDPSHINRDAGAGQHNVAVAGPTTVSSARSPLVPELPRLPTAPVLSGGQHADAIAASLGRLSASNDGWDTEVWTEQAVEQLRMIARAIEQPTGRDTQTTDLDATLQATSLRPDRLSAIFSDGSTEVRRWDVTSPSESIAHGRTVLLADLLESLVSPFLAEVERRVELKIVHITPVADGFETEVAYHGQGRTPEGSLQQNAHWHCSWEFGATTNDRPALRRIELLDYEEIAHVAAPLFAEWTEQIFDGCDSYREQLRYGVNHWRVQLQSAIGIDVIGHQGLALGDANGDGLPDLFICQPGGLPNRLYIQQADGTLLDASRESGLDLLDLTSSALLLDLDNDGDQDLVAVTRTSLLFFENDGHGRFSVAAAERDNATTSFSLCAADYDDDGDLDIYVCGYSYPSGRTTVPLPYHDANNGFANRLLRNEGNWRFRNVTVESGLEQNNRRYSFAAAWEDYDNDGDVDLYVANDYGRNNLYQNNNGHFHDVAAEAGVEDISAGMGVTWSDYDNDGWPDLYVSNMFSSAGNRVTYQRRFLNQTDDATRGEFQRHARGNSLFRNNRDGTFSDVSVRAGVTMGRWAWSSLFCDINNDGWDDLLVANGNMTNEESDDL